MPNNMEPADPELVCGFYARKIQELKEQMEEAISTLARAGVVDLQEYLEFADE